MLLRLCFKALLKEKVKTLILMVTMMMSIAVSSSLVGLFLDARTQIQEELNAYGANFIVKPLWNDSGEGISSDDFDKIVKTLPPQSTISPHLNVVTESKEKEVLLVGLHFSEERKLSGHWDVEGGWGQSPAHAMVGHLAAQRLGMRLGDKVFFSGVLPRGFVVQGIFKGAGLMDEYCLLDLKEAQSLIPSEIKISSMHARINGTLEYLERIAQEIEDSYPELDANPVRRIAVSEGKVLDRVESLIWMVTGLIFVMTALTVIATSTALVSERREEFALSRALGASNLRLALHFYSEVLMAFLLVSPIGFFLGYLGLNQLAKTIFASEATFRWAVIPGVWSIVLLVILTGGSVAARRICKIEPATVLKGE